MEDTDKYIKTHTIFCFWHSDDLNTMTHLRKVALECLQSVSKCKVELITPSRLNDFIVDGYPLHPAFEYLSDVHKSDYLRMYFMHFHGGGYSDIKVPTMDLNYAFEEMLANKSLIVNTYRPECEEHIAYVPNMKYYRDLIGLCTFIMRPKTDLTYKWYNEVHALLDSKLESLKKNPSTHSYDKAELGSGYPIEWNEMLGRILHKIVLEFKDNIIFTINCPVLVHYR